MRKVIALYDFEADEKGTLSFNTGDIIEMLDEEDDTGWCLGRKDREIGFYPPSFVTGIYMSFLLHRINFNIHCMFII